VAGLAIGSWLPANRSRSLGNLATRGSSILNAARSAGLARKRARQPAQDAAWRNRERVTNDFSDGRKASPSRPPWQAPSTRKPYTRLRPRVLDGTHLPERRSARCQPRRNRSNQHMIASLPGKMDNPRAAPADPEWAMAALTLLTRGASSAVPHGRKAGGSRVEEDFPAAPKEPEANPWLPETYEHAGRPRGASAPSAQRAQEAHRERAQEVGPVSDKGRQEGLARRDRLRARSCFLAAQRRGRRIPGRNLVVYALTRPEQERKERARIGITVSKKVGNAVVRNRVKRWLRESYRRLASSAPGGTDLVFIARPATAQSSYQRTAAELSELLVRAGRP